MRIGVSDLIPVRLLEERLSLPSCVCARVCMCVCVGGTLCPLPILQGKLVARIYLELNDFHVDEYRLILDSASWRRGEGGCRGNANPICSVVNRAAEPKPTQTTNL